MTLRSPLITRIQVASRTVATTAQDQLDHLNLAIVGGGREPFYQTDWPNPIVRSRAYLTAMSQDQIDTLNPVLAGGGIKPFLQTDWQNPRGYRQPVKDWAVSLPLTITTFNPQPFAQSDWPNPRGYRPSTQFLINSALISGGGVEPFYQTDWPNPRLGPKPRVVQDWIIPGITASFNTNLTLAALTWAWAKQANTFQFTNNLSTKAWNWNGQTAGMISSNVMQQKGWTWVKQAPQTQFAYPLVSQVWSWVTQSTPLQTTINLATKAWNWSSQGIAGTFVTLTRQLIKAGSKIFNP